VDGLVADSWFKAGTLSSLTAPAVTGPIMCCLLRVGCCVLVVGVRACCKTRRLVMLFFETFGATRTHSINLALIHKFAPHPPNME